MDILDWTGDLNLGGTSIPAEEWLARFQQYAVWHRYYAGLVLEDRVEGVDKPPLMYPVKMNVTKLMCHTQADALWGEWEDRLFTVELAPLWADQFNETQVQQADKLRRIFHHIMDRSAIESKAWQIGLDSQRFGGGVLRVARSKTHPFGVRLDRVPVRMFYPVWNPDDLDDLLEVYIAFEISARAAELKYGVKTNRDVVMRVEHWDTMNYTNWIDGKKIDSLSGYHGWGIVPFVYFPRQRSDSFFGDALTPDLMGPQDEINMRVGDVGDALNTNTHPIRYGYNLPKNINDPAKFPFAPNALWDLGLVLPGQEPPKIELMEAAHAVSPQTSEHIKFVLDWGRHAANSPPVVFGEDEGSQRSGATLTIRMWPLTRSVRRTRAHYKPCVRRLTDIIMRVADREISSVLGSGVRKLYTESQLNTNFAPILPRERTEIVSEVVARLSTNPPSVSLPKALEMLDERDIAREMKRIEETAEFVRKQQEVSMQLQQKYAPKEEGEKKKAETREKSE